MQLNYLAFGLISFIPIIAAFIWYNPSNTFGQKIYNESRFDFKGLGIKKIIPLYILLIFLLYGFLNVTIHQVGYYELFFTDIMKGSVEAKAITEEFLSQYGDKHRHFGHGAFHGAINAVCFVLPLVAFHAMLSGKTWRYVTYHMMYWFFVSVLCGGLISEFV